MKGRAKSFISSLFCFGLGIIPVMADAGANHTGNTLQVTQQAKRSLSGTVTDAATGEPLIGVSILVKGTQGGTITDTNGNFSLPVNNGDILEVSYIGYKKESIVVKGQQTLNIAMQTDSEIL